MIVGHHCHNNHITVSAHIIDIQWCPISFTLTNHEVHERHAAENLTQQLENTFNEWEIVKKIITMVTDNEDIIRIL
jgi:hypothetical protein